MIAELALSFLINLGIPAGTKPFIGVGKEFTPHLEIGFGVDQTLVITSYGYHSIPLGIYVQYNIFDTNRTPYLSTSYYPAIYRDRLTKEWGFSPLVTTGFGIGYLWRLKSWNIGAELAILYTGDPETKLDDRYKLLELNYIGPSITVGYKF